MTAGSGVVHSERMPPEQAHERCVNHGLQLWRALPEAHEEDAAFVVHTSASAIPGLAVDGATVLVATDGPARFAVVGGLPVGHRFIWWNFVSSRNERIELPAR